MYHLPDAENFFSLLVPIRKRAAIACTYCRYRKAVCQVPIGHQSCIRCITKDKECKFEANQVMVRHLPSNQKSWKHPDTQRPETTKTQWLPPAEPRARQARSRFNPDQQWTEWCPTDDWQFEGAAQPLEPIMLPVRIDAQYPVEPHMKTDRQLPAPIHSLKQIQYPAQERPCNVGSAAAYPSKRTNLPTRRDWQLPSEPTEWCTNNWTTPGAYPAKPPMPLGNSFLVPSNVEQDWETERYAAQTLEPSIVPCPDTQSGYSVRSDLDLKMIGSLRNGPI